MKKNNYSNLVSAKHNRQKLLAVLIDPEKCDVFNLPSFFKQLPAATTHIFVGGSTVEALLTETVVIAIKKQTTLPVIIFPGAADQISDKADALLFLSLLSGTNPEYLIGQQKK